MVISNEQLAVSNEQRAISNEQLAISSEQRTINNELFCSCGLCGSWLIIFLIFFIPYSLFSQQIEPAFQIETRFIQRLNWTPNEYALYYEVEIERQEDGIFTRFIQERTENSFIQVSLTQGFYRYRVTPYDLLDLPGITTDWLEFEIIQAFEPEINGFSPDAITLSENVDEYVLDIFGNNFLAESEIYLIRLGSNTKIFPFKIEISSGGRTARIFFNDSQLSGGVHHIVVENPGGFEASISIPITDRPDNIIVVGGGGFSGPMPPSLLGSTVDRLFIGLSPEINAFTRSGFAVGGSLFIGFEINRHFVVGQKTGYFNDLADLNTLDIQGVFRYKLPFLKWPDSGSGPYVQAEAGMMFYFEYGEIYPSFAGGLSLGWRFNLGNYFFVEPFGRGGYPYLWGGGVILGVRFKQAADDK